MKRDYAGFLKKIESLDKSDLEYILGLPWPRAIVYHELDERMERIVKKIRVS